MKNKLIFISSVTTPQRAYENMPELKDFDVQFFSAQEDSSVIIDKARDTQFIIVDAMGKVERQVIEAMPNLKLIQSEGVGYQGVDVEAARENGVIVCNNKGINDTAVAEVAVFLILGCLKSYTSGAKSVYAGTQIQTKIASFGVVREMSECTVGLLGFGDIARQTARLLNAFGCRVVYSNRTRYPDLEQKYNVEYMELDHMLEVADFVSLHLAVNDDTRNIVNEAFLNKMKNSAYIVNTARGDLVDNEALLNALKNGVIAGAGLDVIAPEPVTADNILLDKSIEDKLVLTPHIAGITSLTVKKIYRNSYDNIMAVINGKAPKNIIS